MDWAWVDGEWKYVPGTNPFVPFPKWNPEEFDLLDVMSLPGGIVPRYVDKDVYQKFRTVGMESTFEIQSHGLDIYAKQTNRDILGIPYNPDGEGFYKYGQLFDSPYKHWDKIPLDEVSKYYAHGLDVSLNAGGPIEEGGVAKYGERLTTPSGYLDTDASSKAMFDLMIESYGYRVDSIYRKAALDKLAINAEADLRIKVEIIRTVATDWPNVIPVADLAVSAGKSLLVQASERLAGRAMSRAASAPMGFASIQEYQAEWARLVISERSALARDDQTPIFGPPITREPAGLGGMVWGWARCQAPQEFPTPPQLST